MTRRQPRAATPADLPGPGDRAAVVGLMLDRTERGRWPTVSERPDLAGRRGTVTVGPDRHPFSTVMPADPVVAARAIADPIVAAVWAVWDDGPEARSEAVRQFFPSLNKHNSTGEVA